MTTKQKIIHFFDRQGLYIVLVICIGLVGATAFYTSSQNQPMEPQSNLETANATKPPLAIASATPLATATPPPATQATSSGEAQASPTPTPAPTPTAKPPSKSPSATPAMANVIITRPVSGEASLPFANETLVFSKTLRQWTTHPGIDIPAKQGTEVRAALSGTVTSVVEDAAMGMVVTIEHSNGLKTVYASLEKAKVQKDARVDAGTVIGTVGVAPFESEEGPHLHFEVYKDGKAVDPATYLTGAKS